MSDPRYIQLSDTRFVIKDTDLLRRTVPKWLGKAFAFDLETTGLSWQKHHAVGIALTFEDGKSFYVCLEHIEVFGEIVRRTREEEIEGEPEEVPVLTKTGKQSCFKDGTPKFKKVKTYKTVDVEYDDDQRTYETVRYITDEDAAEILAPLFDQPTVPMLAHNMKFDLHFVDNIRIAPYGCLIDTMLAAKLIDENREVGLKELGKDVLGRTDAESFKALERYPGFKKEEFLGVPLPIGADYALRDTEMTLGLWQVFQPQLAEEGADKAFYELWMPLTVTLFEMEKAGIALDLDLVREVKVQYEAKRAAAEESIFRAGMEMVYKRYGVTGESGEDYSQLLADGTYVKTVKSLPPDLYEQEGPWVYKSKARTLRLPVLDVDHKARLARVPWFNIGSNPQMQELIYGHMGLKPPPGIKIKVMDNGNYSVDADTIKTLRFYLDDPPKILQDILDYRKAEKFIGTYLDRFLSDADPNNHNTIHTTFNQTTAATGRLSSSNPINLQNIPSRGPEGEMARRMFVARPGYKLVVADYSMMELRVMAHYTLDPSFLQAFEEGKDLHILTGANQSGMTYEQLYEAYKAGDVDAKLKRSIGKTSNFGLGYGMAAVKYRNELRVENGVDVSLDESKALIKGYEKTFEVSQAWKQDQVIPRILQRGYVLTMFGRKRRLPEIWSRDRWERMRAERQGINAIIQGTCADIMAFVIPRIQEELRPLGGRLLLQVHDELVAEVPTEHAEAFAPQMGLLMTEEINKKLRVPLVAEASVGDNWGEAK